MAYLQTSNYHHPKDRADQNEHKIEYLCEKDDPGFPSTWKRKLYGLRLYLNILSTSSTYAYLALRTHYLLGSQAQYLEIIWASWIFLAIEIMVNCEHGPNAE